MIDAKNAKTILSSLKTEPPVFLTQKELSDVPLTILSMELESVSLVTEQTLT